MIDYYQVLGVARDANADQIKRTFRQLAHRYHPDRNAARRRWAQDKMRVAIEAYRVIGNRMARIAYDRRLDLEAERNRDAYRENLLYEKHKPAARAALILYDLMADRADEAIDAFEEGLLEGSFDLSKHLAPKDWLDCSVLLAEQYESRKCYDWALRLYEEVYESALAKRRYGEFFHEICDRIRNLCCRVLAKNAPCEKAVGYYARALKLDLSGPESAFIHKKMAECYLEANRRDEAIASLNAAFEISPNMKGARRICEKLGYNPGVA